MSRSQLGRRALPSQSTLTGLVMATSRAVCAGPSGLGSEFSLFCCVLAKTQPRGGGRLKSFVWPQGAVMQALSLQFQSVRPPVAHPRAQSRAGRQVSAPAKASSRADASVNVSRPPREQPQRAALGRTSKVCNSTREGSQARFRDGAP